MDLPEPGVGADTAPEEKNALLEFEVEWNKRLDAKIEEEKVAAAKVEEAAKKELDDWKKQREIRLEKKKETNRSTEKVFVEQIESALVSKNTWERVTKLVDISQDAADSEKSDVGKMRSLFVQLKNKPVEGTA